MVHFRGIVQTTYAGGTTVRSRGWAEFQGWSVGRRDGVPVARQIYMQVRAAITSGRLKPGARLPSTRRMAATLTVARTTVVTAYEQLLTEGYANSRSGSGTFVSEDMAGLAVHAPQHSIRRTAPRPSALPESARLFAEIAREHTQPDERPFNPGRTLVDAQTVEVWRRLTTRAARSLGGRDLGYTDPCGFIELRVAICDYLRAVRAVQCDPGQIVITAGTQQAIDIAIRVLLAPGDEVWIEDPGYPLTYGQLILARMQPRPIPVDRLGLRVELGVRTASGSRMAIVTPSHQYPTGVTMSINRRLELLEWARDNDAYVIEDDYASEYRYSGSPLASLQGLDRTERVVYIGTFNKSLFPGLRIGYAVVPQLLLPAFASARLMIDRQPPSLQQIVLSEFLTQGHFTAHVRRMCQKYREQRDALAETLNHHVTQHCDVDVPDQGMHLVARLKHGLVDTVIAARANENGVITRAMSRLYRATLPQQALLLGFSGYPRSVIVPAAVRLSKIILQSARTDGRTF
jgi:GntR family transcriptional regulator/MocR family aminotransferase